jgi:hypothetical protein
MPVSFDTSATKVRGSRSEVSIGKFTQNLQQSLPECVRLGDEGEVVAGNFDTLTVKACGDNIGAVPA